MKTAISIPDELFIVADNYAKDLGVSRSYLYATAVAKFLEQRSANHLIRQRFAFYETIKIAQRKCH